MKQDARTNRQLKLSQDPENFKTSGRQSKDALSDLILGPFSRCRKSFHLQAQMDGFKILTGMLNKSGEAIEHRRREKERRGERGRESSLVPE